MARVKPSVFVVRDRAVDFIFHTVNQRPVFVANLAEHGQPFGGGIKLAVLCYHILGYQFSFVIEVKAPIGIVRRLDFGDGSPEQRGQMQIARMLVDDKGVLFLGRNQIFRGITVGGNKPTDKLIAGFRLHFEGNACVLRQVFHVEVSFFRNVHADKLTRAVFFDSCRNVKRIAESCVHCGVLVYGEFVNVFGRNQRCVFAFAVVPADEFIVNG